MQAALARKRAPHVRKIASGRNWPPRTTLRYRDAARGGRWMESFRFSSGGSVMWLCIAGGRQRMVARTSSSSRSKSVTRIRPRRGYSRSMVT